MAPLLARLGLGGGHGFGFGKKSAVSSGAAIIEEYVFFAGDSGTLSVPAQTTRIQVAGVAAGGGGGKQNAFGGRNISGGGAAASNVRGDFFLLGGASTIYYSVAADTNIEGDGSSTFIKQTNSGGTDIFRLNGGFRGTDNVPLQAGGAGGSVSVPVAGPNAIAGGNGGAGAPPPNASRTGQVVGNFGCAGGGGGGSHDNNNLPGFDGSSGGTSTIPSDSESLGGALESNGVGPAPTTWKFKKAVTPGGSGGAGGAVPTYATAGGSVARAYGGGGGEGAGNPQGGGGGGGGGGAGVGWDDPSSPYNNNYFGGGGGGSGYSSPLSYSFPAASRGVGAGGILVIRFRRD